MLLLMPCISMPLGVSSMFSVTLTSRAPVFWIAIVTSMHRSGCVPHPYVAEDRQRTAFEVARAKPPRSVRPSPPSPTMSGSSNAT